MLSILHLDSQTTLESQAPPPFLLGLVVASGFLMGGWPAGSGYRLIPIHGNHLPYVFLRRACCLYPVKGCEIPQLNTETMGQDAHRRAAARTVGLPKTSGLR